MWFIKYGLLCNVSGNGLSPTTGRAAIDMYRILAKLSYAGPQNDCSSVFCPRWVLSSDQTSDSTGNKRSLWRCVISNISIQIGCHTLIMAPLADRPTISQLDTHKFASFSEFTTCQVPRMCYICEWPPLNMLSSCYWTLSSFKPLICSSVFTFIVSFIFMVRPL